MRNLVKLMLVLGVFAVVASSCKKEEDPEQQHKVWNGPNITFTKIDGADWTLQANQDRMTANVWITRANSKGIFNFKQELSYSGSDNIGQSPLDTEWALGTTSDNLSDLTFKPWARLHNGLPKDLIGRDLVVHLKTDDIYLNLKFISWSDGDSGGQGGFSYSRSTP